MILAVASAVVWFVLGPQPRLVYALVVFVTTLIITCPCALGLATPTSLTVGIGKAAEQGILIRSGDALQSSQRLQTIVLDKTGTITRGAPSLTDLVAVADVEESELLRLAAAVEQGSEHPLASAIVDGARNRGQMLPDASEFEAIPGLGVSATVEGRRVLLGNARLMQDRAVPLGRLEAEARRLADAGKTPMYVAVGGAAAGLVGVADTVKEDSTRAVRAMQRLGLEVVMLPATIAGRAKRSGDRSVSIGFSPRCCRPTRLTRSSVSSSRGRPSGWSATASTMPRPSPRRTSVSRSAPARMWRSRLPT